MNGLIGKGGGFVYRFDWIGDGIFYSTSVYTKSVREILDELDIG